MWVYIERLDNGRWVNSGTVQVDYAEHLKNNPRPNRISKKLVSEPLRSMVKTPYFAVLASSLKEGLELPGIALIPSMVYRLIFPVKAIEQEDAPE